MPSFLSRLFGKSETSPKQPVAIAHNGFRIFPEPIKEGSVYRIAARIEKDVNGKTLAHSLVRADTHGTPESASEASVAKAKQAIDQLGDTIFR